MCFIYFSLENSAVDSLINQSKQNIGKIASLTMFSKHEHGFIQSKAAFNILKFNQMCNDEDCSYKNMKLNYLIIKTKQ